ncbi:metallophosphoesterase family protein [Marininema mesophilum]|nr:DNA repair exonuclease [Marininema mesophilum]
MNDVTFLHTADLHIDLPVRGFKGNERQRATRHDDYRRTFGRIVDLCVERKVDFLFIAGDFLEYATVRRQTVAWVISQLERIAETKVLIAPGNHDPLREDSFYRTLSWPENVHFFAEEWEEKWYPEMNLRIWGRGFTQFEEQVTRYPTVNGRTDERRLMILHGTFPMQEESGPYYPLSETGLTPLEMDYIALGHIHQARDMELNNQRRTKISYPGSPEALNWTEIGERRVILGKMTPEGFTIESIPIESRCYEIDEINLTGCETEEELCERILVQIPPGQGRDSCRRLILEGRRRVDFELSEDWILLQLEEAGFFYVELIDHTIPDYDLEKLAQEEGLTGVFLRRMQERVAEAKEEEQGMLERALYQGLDALLGSEVSKG